MCTPYSCKDYGKSLGSTTYGQRKKMTTISLLNINEMMILKYFCFVGKLLCYDNVKQFC